MPFKGNNSILFEFDSIIDWELSWVEYFRAQYRDLASEVFNKHEILYESDDDMRFNRIYGSVDLFESFLNDKYKDQARDIFDGLIQRDGDKILKFAKPTAMQPLIKAYKRAADGVVKTSVRCDTEEQRKYILNTLPMTNIIMEQRDQVDMSKYGRIVVGYWKDLIPYKMDEPKSIHILNFRENLHPHSIKEVHPEIIILFGDVDEIRLVSAYQSNEHDIPNFEG